MPKSIKKTYTKKRTSDNDALNTDHEQKTKPNGDDKETNKVTNMECNDQPSSQNNDTTNNKKKKKKKDKCHHFHIGHMCRGD